jgi:hypothetical protein
MRKKSTAGSAKSSGSGAQQPKGNSYVMSLAALRDIGASKSDLFNNHLANALLATIWVPKGESAEGQEKTLAAVMTAVAAFKPSDDIESMVAVQAVSMHFAVMECNRRAIIPDQGFEAGREYRKAASNASRVFVELLAALDRKRGKGGQQKVTVEHVHVHAGGNAIVGAVAPTTPTGGGGGVEGKSGGEPRASPARLAHDAAVGTVIPALRRAHPEREPVPVTGNAERPL